MTADEKMDADNQSDGGRVTERTGHKVGEVIVIDWIHHQVAILGFNQHQPHTHTHSSNQIYAE